MKWIRVLQAHALPILLAHALPFCLLQVGEVHSEVSAVSAQQSQLAARVGSLETRFAPQ